MEQNHKTIMDAEQAVLRRSGEGSALKESERVLSTSEVVFLRNMQERGVEIFSDKPMITWVASNMAFEERQSYELKYYDFLNTHDQKKIDGESDWREHRFRHYDPGDLIYNLERVFGQLDAIKEIPELIIIQTKNGEYPGAWAGIPKRVQDAVDGWVNELFRYWREDINMHLSEHVCAPIDNKFDFTKVALNEDELVEYGLTKFQSIEIDLQNELFGQYIFTGDVTYIQKFFTDDVLREIYDDMGEFDEAEADNLTEDFWDSVPEEGEDAEDGFFANFREKIDHDVLYREWQITYDQKVQNGEDVEDDDEYDRLGREVYAAKDNYMDYRQALASYAKSVPFETIKEKMRTVYCDVVRRELDVYTSEYLQDHDTFEAEKKLLKPIIVCATEDPVQQELMRDYGTDVVVNNIDMNDINALLELVGKTKSSAASLMPEKLRRIKSAFYRSVEDKLDARSEITADLEQEIAILEHIFDKVGNIKKILDVGCGKGRVDIPLAQKGYNITGVDGNERFLQDALREVLQKNITGAQFKKGDVIDYRGVVDPGTQDAVIYTWHSILEAFGPGNMLQTLGNAWSSLRPGGVLVFDQPTRENEHMEDGWYGNAPDSEHQYLAYVMEEKEIELLVKMAGFENVEITKWTTKPSDEYPEGMHKFTISARKPNADESSVGMVQMYRQMAQQHRWHEEESKRRAEDDRRWLEEYQKRKSA